MGLRLRDRNGNTVEHVRYTLPDRECFVVRGPNGRLLHGTYGTPEPTTPAQVAALGVDLASLKETA